MGIDAEMKVLVPREISSGELKRWSYVFGSAFHYDLMLGFDDNIYHKPLSVDTEFAEYSHGIEPKVGTTVLDVPLSGRYYGEGYERGPITTYIIIAEFLERMIGDCIVYYFGDSGGADSAEVFDKARRDELLDHFISVARDPYIKGFDRENDGPDCPVCEVKMIRNGWGNNYKLFSCSGCGWMQREKDNEITKGFNIKS